MKLKLDFSNKVPKEAKDNELRVAATPDVVKNLIKLEHSVVVEKSAGEGSFISDENFKDAGADLLDSKFIKSDSPPPIPTKINPLRIGFLGKDWERKGGPFLYPISH